MHFIVVGLSLLVIHMFRVTRGKKRITFKHLVTFPNWKLDLLYSVVGARDPT